MKGLPVLIPPGVSVHMIHSFLYQCCNAIRSPWLPSDTQALAECPFVPFHAEDVFAADALASEASLHSAQLFLFFSPGLCSRSFQGRVPKSHYLKMPVSAGTLYLPPAVCLRKRPSYLGSLVSRWFLGDRKLRRPRCLQLSMPCVPFGLLLLPWSREVCSPWIIFLLWNLLLFEVLPWVCWPEVDIKWLS